MSILEEGFRTISIRGVNLSKDLMEFFQIRKIRNSMAECEISISPDSGRELFMTTFNTDKLKNINSQYQ